MTWDSLPRTVNPEPLRLETAGDRARLEFPRLANLLDAIRALFRR